MKTREIPAVESLLKSNERWCMNACGRYINRKSLKGEVWTLHDETGKPSALVVHAGRGLLPVLCGRTHIPALHFLNGFFAAAPVYSVQGKKTDVLIMETEMEKMEMVATEKADFDLMCMDRPPGGFRSAGPPKLIIRKPESTDMESLVALHAAYEKEEVLPPGRNLNLATSRMNMEHIFQKEQMLVAELDGHVIGKINTNAVAFTRCQVGGVYVHPDFRGLGIARRMAGEFIAGLIAQGRGISLFVKKSNIAARQVYQGIGFEILGNYRINYYAANIGANRL
ncbi:MAG: GNAT family N-acetyltransferase [Treponema sp.]|nr:GNAT family N-acetyltransferase [Treponema sp.]